MLIIKVVSQQARVTKMYGCTKFRIIRDRDGVYIRLDDQMRELAPQGATVYIMNNDGKTIDSFDV